jgi:hypothetical protein
LILYSPRAVFCLPRPTLTFRFAAENVFISSNHGLNLIITFPSLVYLFLALKPAVLYL